MLNLDNLPDSSPSGVAPGNVGVSLDVLPDTNEDALRGLYRQHKINPDEFAKSRMLSKSTGLPMPTVQNNQAQAAAIAAEPDWGNLQRTSPKTAEALVKNTELFNLAKDDTENLSMWDRFLNATWRAGKRGFVSGVQGTDAANVVDAIEILDTVGKIERGELKDDVQIARATKFASLFAGVGRDPENLAAMKSRFQQQLNDNALEFLQRAEKLRTKDMLPTKGLQELNTATSFGDAAAAVARNPSVVPELISQSLGTLAPYMPAMVAGGVAGPGALAAATGTSSMATEYMGSLAEVFQEMGINLADTEGSRKAINSPEFQERMRTKGAKAAVIGLFDALTAGVAGVPLAPAKVANKTGKAAINIAAQTGVQAAGGGAGEAFGALAAGEDVSPGAVLSEMIAEMPGGAVDVLLLGAKRAGADAVKTQDAVRDAQQLEQMFQVAAQSKLLQRSPETFAQFVQGVADQSEGALKEVYIDAQTFADVLAQAGVEQGAVLGAMPSVAEQMQEAMATGGALAIPIGEFTAHMTGTGLESVLIPHLRTAEDALSLTEAQQASEQAQQYLQQQVQEVMQQASDAEAVKASADVVKTEILGQLNTAKRFTADVNEAYATLVRDFYTVMAARTNVTPEELYRRRPMRVLAGTEQGAQTLLDEKSSAVIAGLETDPNIASLADKAPALQQLYRASAKIKPAFDNTMQGIARLVDGGTKLSALKGTKRAVAKISTDYNGDPTKIKDLVRGTIEVRSVAQAQQAIQQILAAFPVLKTGQRNLLRADVNPVDGYRDAKFNVDLGNGVVGEVQVNIPSMLAAKKQVHGLYTERSELERTIQNENRQPTAGEQARIDALNAKMRAVYEPAWAEALATSASNSTSETGAPLRRADSGSNGLGGETSQAEQYAAAPGTGPSETGTPSTSKNSAISFTSESSIADADVLEQSVSTRVPTGKKATENPLSTQLVADFETVKRSPALVEKFAAKLDAILSLRTRKFKDPAKRIEAYIDQMVDNLLWLHDQVPAEIAQRSKLWYDGARNIVDRWGPKYGNRYSDVQLSAVMAVMSPQMDWFQNVTLAERIIDVWDQRQNFRWTDEMTDAASRTAMTKKPEQLASITGKTLAEVGDSDLQALWVAAFDLAYNPREFHVITPEGDFADVSRNNDGTPMKGSWANGFAPIAKAVEVLKDGSLENVSAMLGGKHKVRNFYNNIFAPNAPDGSVTADTHAVAAALLMPLSGTSPEVMDNFGAAGGDINLGISGTYPIYAEAYRRAAAQRGLLPREMQSITWEAVRGLFSPSFKSTYKANPAAFDKIWKDFHAEQIELDAAREQLVAFANGITPPEWFRPDSAGADPRWTASYAGELLGGGRVGGATRRGAGGDAAASVIFEVAPDPNDAALTDAWRQLSSGERKTVSGFISRVVVPRVMRAIGGAGTTTGQVGSYLEDTNPSFALRLTAGDPLLAARVTGFVLGQDSMVVVSAKPFEGGSEVGAVEIEVGDKTTAEIDQLYQTLRQIKINGEQPIGGQTTVDGKMAVLNYSNVPTEELATAVDQALAGSYNVKTHAVYSAFPEKQEYDYASDQSDTGGNDSAIRQWARDARAEVGQLLRAELARIQDVGGTYQQSAVRGGAERANAPDGGDGRAANPHAANITGVHFSRERRALLDGRYFGTGLKGIEQTRLAESPDPRIRERVYFYVDEGSGIRPEAGVGGIAHTVDLTNLYNTTGDPLKLFRANDINGSESRVLDAGFDGYYFPKYANGQGIAIVMGKATRGMKAEAVATPGSTYAPEAVAPAQYKRGLLSREMALVDLPAVQAVAPSAQMRAGNFSVNQDELAAAREVLTKQGVNLPDAVLNQSMAEDMGAQGAFLQEKAQAAGYTNVDDWAANDIAAFIDAAQEWRTLNPAESLAQPARGTFNPRTLGITLLKDADLTTFLHETGHFFLEMIADLAGQTNAPADIQADMGALLKWFGVKDLATWNGMSLNQKRASHEKFAESFEQYLFEGKAPSAELKPLFRRFREWMTSVYKSLTEFAKRHDTQLSDEVRAVFDRMLAVDAQIKETERAAGMLPDFDSTNEAIETLQARSLRDLKWTVNARSKMLKQLQADIDAKRKAVKAEVTTEVRAMPEYAVQRFLKFGELDGEKVEGGKLSLPVMREMYGEGPAAQWRYLATNMVTKDETTGLHPNMVAEIFGFPNGDEMIRAVLNAQPEDAMIDGMTDQRLLERYGDLATDKGIERAANEAVHNEVRARFVASEIKAMREGMNQREKTPAGGTINVIVQAAKEFAQNLVARRKVRDLKPGLHTAAEARAAKRATAAQMEGKTAEALAAKRDQLLSHYAAKFTMDAQAEIDKKLDYLRKFEKDSVRAKLPPDYLVQIDTLLERFDLRRGVSLKAIDKRVTLLAWVQAQQDLGLDPTVPEELLDEAARKSYKDMTVEEFRGLTDTVRNIEHLGRLKDKLLTLKDKREFQAVVDDVAGSIRDNATKERVPRIDAPTRLDKAADLARGFFSSHRKLASLVRQMDGNQDGGAFWNAFVRTMNAAADGEAVMREKATKQLSAIFEPLLKNNKLREKEFIPAINRSLSLEARLAVALNWGNDANRQRVMDGDRWSQRQVEAILATLTQEQLQFVQRAWDYVDTFWPEIKAKEERVSGVAPEKVAASPIAIKLQDGTVVNMKGGYYPIKYDTDRSSKADADNAAEITKQMLQGQYTRASTRRGHTKQRAEEVNRAVRKDIGVIFQHVEQVAHDLSWHEWLIDANRLLRAGPIDSAIRETMGPEVLREFNKALLDIAAGDVPAQSEFETAINHLRQGTTIVGLGWNLMTSLMQPLGLTQSAVRIGPKWVGKGLARWIGDAARMESTAKEVYAKSEFMRLRGETMNREIREIRNRVQGAKFTALEETYFYLIQKGQIIADMPTWLGQYEKAMATGPSISEEEAIAQADQAVRDSQGGGAVSDLARMQRGSPLMKLFTNFYSFFNTTFNLTAERFNGTSFKDPLQAGRFMVDMLLLYTVPALLGFAIKEALRGSDSGDDEDKLVGKLIREQLNYLLGTIVGLRELGAAVQGFAGYQGPAGTRFFSEIAKFSKQVEQGEVDQALLKSLNNTTGILLHYPAGQVNRMVEGYLAYTEGRTDNPMALLVGPPTP